MQYFSLLPNVFVGEGITDDEPYRYRLVKNLFRRTKVRQDLDQYITLLETRIIPDGMRPEEVSLQALGSPYLDWILLMVNEITDVYEQWPRSEERLLDYVQKKYDLPDDVHHYETVEIRNRNNVIMVQKGLKVTSDYSITYFDERDGGMVTKYPVKTVTNYDYEESLQDKRRNIFLLKPRYLNIVLDDLELIMTYKKGSSQYKTESMKTADNIRLFE